MKITWNPDVFDQCAREDADHVFFPIIKRKMDAVYDYYWQPKEADFVAGGVFEIGPPAGIDNMQTATIVNERVLLTTRQGPRNLHGNTYHALVDEPGVTWLKIKPTPSAEKLMEMLDGVIDSTVISVGCRADRWALWIDASISLPSWTQKTETVRALRKEQVMYMLALVGEV
jgi:hypothetical protein